MSQRGKREDFRQYVFDFDPPEDLNRSNIKPTQNVLLVINDENGNETVEARWWFQKEGAREFETKYTTFNARSEKLASSFLYRNALKKKRCLVPVTSFYEWNEKGKPPFEIFLANKKPFALAGLWSNWYDEDAKKFSFTVITTEPNEFMSPIHNRMPAILGSKETQKLWLTEGALDFLKPFDGELKSTKLKDRIENIYKDAKRSE
jgi:putative SOS response-associated peptidase YedK